VLFLYVIEINKQTPISAHAEHARVCIPWAAEEVRVTFQANRNTKDSGFLIAASQKKPPREWAAF
jgi:hypothetical protein